MRAGRLLGALLLLLLAAGAAYAVGRDDQSASPPTTITTTSVPPSSPVTSLPSTTPSTASATTAIEEPGQDPVAVARQGLSAWGRFAVTGDLAHVEDWFHPRGPQWEQFRREAPRLAAHPLGEPPYTVVADDIEVETAAEETVVRARVSFVRTGEPSQTFHWSIRLRDEHGWRIWTVEETRPHSSDISNP